MSETIPPVTQVTITQQNDHDTLIRVESKVDGLITTVSLMRDEQTKTLSDHEIRIRNLETNKSDLKASWKTIGVIGGIVMGAASFVYVIVALVSSISGHK